MVPSWKLARKLKVNGANKKYPKAAPEKKHNETQPMLPFA
jgi:hypothetical protein